jgi:hypothetical protein
MSNVRVVRQADRWGVKQDAPLQILRIYDTLAEAIQRARALARSTGARLLLPDGDTTAGAHNRGLLTPS